MPLIPDPPSPKSQGDTVRSKDWNDAINEVIRLDAAKLDLIGGHITGPLQIDGPVGIGTTTPDQPLSIQSSAGAFMNLQGNAGAVELMLGADTSGGIVSTTTNSDLQLRAGSNATRMTIKSDGKVGIGTATPEVTLHVSDIADVGPFAVRPGEVAPGRLMVTGANAEIGFARRTMAAWPAAPVAGDRFLWYDPDGTARLWTEVKGDLLKVDAAANVTLTGDLTIPKSAGTATFTGRDYGNESSFHANNLKLEMAAQTGLTALQPYEFAIGHKGFRITPFPFGIASAFVKRFSINENGDLYCSGSKTGYVVDFFLNRSNQALQQGDVVVITESQQLQYYGTNHDIPIVEADLTDQAYDHRVCGIVAQMVAEADLPSMDFNPQTEEEARNLPTQHPMLAFAAVKDDAADQGMVGAGRMGKMATLGAYGYCNVDADISPIQAGDLLTTSPTRGHAQKVLDTQKALGTIIGKAMAPLARGKGQIPVLVMMQ